MNTATTAKLLAAIAVGTALAHSAFAGQIDLKLQNAGLASAPEFTADALKATEVSHISFTSPTTFLEHGFAQITGVLNNNVLSTPTGLNSTYSLYFDFTITGDLITSQFSTFSFDFYGVDGVSTFAFDNSNNATVNNGANTAILLATNSLISGSVAGAPPGDLSAQSLSTFTPTIAGAPAFIGPSLPATFQGTFFHSAAQPGGITFAQDGSVLINGGDDTLNFTPEPSSMMLLMGGVPALLLLRRKR